MKFFILLILCFYYTFAGANVDKTKITQLTISLNRQKPVLHRLLEMGLSTHVVGAMVRDKICDDKLMMKNLEKKKKPKPKPDVHNDTIQLCKHMDSEFYGIIQLGKPGQSFRVVFDTAWGDSFVPSSRCDLQSAACAKHWKYNHDRSSTYVANETKFYIPFDGENITGVFAQDLLHLGHINVTNQTFVEVTYLPKTFLASVADGIFGMGFRSLSKYNVPTFFDNIMNQFPNMPRLFSVYFNKDVTTPKGGSLILGGISEKHYNKKNSTIKYFPVIEPKYWTISMTRAYLSHPTQTYCARGCKAYFDTGLSTISMPKDDLEKLNFRIGASLVPGFTNRYEVSCDTVLKLPRINFVFNDVEFHLKGKEYIQNLIIGPKRSCFTAFEPSTTNDTWGFGGTFLYRHYAIFDVDNKRLGLVPSLL